jgi:hypothetical protein
VCPAFFCGSNSLFSTGKVQVIRCPTLKRLSRVLSALLGQASTQVQIFITLVITYDSAIKLGVLPGQKSWIADFRCTARSTTHSAQNDHASSQIFRAPSTISVANDVSCSPDTGPFAGLGGTSVCDPLWKFDPSGLSPQ